jgi:membrane-associated phospholipid phosphatase
MVSSEPPVLPDHEEARPAGVRDPSRLLWAGAVAALAVGALLLLGTAITRHPFAFDRAIILAVHGAGPVWLREAMIDVTALGSTTVLTLAVATGAALLVVRGLWLTAALVVAATASGSMVVVALKSLFARTRPDFVDHIVTVGGASFPSGHSANSAIVYLTLASLLTQVVRGHATRRFVLTAAALLVTAIGCSRVYLGVHWPSDVLAGWSFGTLWALGWWLAGARARSALVRAWDVTPRA